MLTRNSAGRVGFRSFLGRGGAMGAKAEVAGAPGPVEADMLPRSTEETLGAQLRGLFDHVAGQPVPERIAELIDALEERRQAEADAAEPEL